jgi:MFS family permease
MDFAEPDTRPRGSGLTLALLAFAQFIIAVDYNIVYVALPDIGRSLGFTAHSLQWVVSAYAVVFGGLLLFGGRLTDRLGGRRVFVLGLLIFGLACLAGGSARSPGLLIAARSVQGLGAALLTPATLALINTRFEEGAARTRALAIWGACGSGGLAAGALFGGLLTQAWGWQWVLYVLVPLALLALAATPAILTPDRENKGRTTTGGRGAFDVAGAVLATLGSSLLVLGLVSGPEAGWDSFRGAGAIAAGLILLGAFALVERGSREPLVPLRLLGNRSLITAMAVILVFQSALGGAYYLFTSYLQGVLHYDALQAGLAFVPLTIISMTASLRLAGVLLTAWGPRLTLFAGMAVNGIGMVALLDHGRLIAEGTAEELKRRIPGGHVRLRFAGPHELESAAQLMGVASRDDETLTLQVPSDGSVPALRALLGQLDAEKIDVEGLSLHTPDLDDVFLALTGQPGQPGQPGLEKEILR